MLWRSDSGFLVQLPDALAEPIRKRLAMYILRSKVRVESRSDRLARIGLGGPDAERVLTAAGVQPPAQVLDLIRSQQISTSGRAFTMDSIMRLAGNRYELIVSDDEAAVATWITLQEHGARPAGFDAWRWLTLRAGIAEIGPHTQDEFVAQMLNYELIGGVSFDKGCYPGQEIIARTQYRGTIKRRTLLAHATDALEPLPGMPVFSDGARDQAIGMVVNVAPSPEGGYDLLMSAHVELAAGAVRLSQADGPQLEVLPMPYPIDVPA
jgi:folate-binding protein YgfZ